LTQESWAWSDQLIEWIPAAPLGLTPPARQTITFRVHDRIFLLRIAATGIEKEKTCGKMPRGKVRLGARVRKWCLGETAATSGNGRQDPTTNGVFAGGNGRQRAAMASKIRQQTEFSLAATSGNVRQDPTPIGFQTGQATKMFRAEHRSGDRQQTVGVHCCCGPPTDAPSANGN
jgi:hypothetical protein